MVATVKEGDVGAACLATAAAAADARQRREMSAAIASARSTPRAKHAESNARPPASSDSRDVSDATGGGGGLGGAGGGEEAGGKGGVDGGGGEGGGGLGGGGLGGGGIGRIRIALGALVSVVETDSARTSAATKPAERKRSRSPFTLNAVAKIGSSAALSGCSPIAPRAANAWRRIRTVASSASVGKLSAVLSWSVESPSARDSAAVKLLRKLEPLPVPAPLDSAAACNAAAAVEARSRRVADETPSSCGKPF